MMSVVFSFQSPDPYGNGDPLHMDARTSKLLSVTVVQALRAVVWCEIRRWTMGA